MLTLLSEAFVEELVMLIVEVDDVVEVEVAAEQSSGLTVNFKIGVNTWRYKGVGSSLSLVHTLCEVANHAWQELKYMIKYHN